MSVLSESFNKESFIDLLAKLVPDFRIDELVVRNHSATFEQVQRLGRSEQFSMDVFCIKTSGSTKSRIGITTDSFKILKQYSSTRAIVAYWTETENQWRISLLSATHRIVEGKLSTEFSNPRRHSYLVGPEAKVATATINLVTKGSCQEFEDLEQRFALEVVNRDFYNQIAMLFTKLVGGERKLGSANRNFEPVLVMPNSSTSSDRHEFGVRLLGRIVFCWFLKQKKGSWGVSLLPDSVVPLDLSEKSDIYREIFEPLFFEVLNIPQNGRKKKLRNPELDIVPYLNGGLFEPLPGPSGDCYQSGSELVIPDEWFRELFKILNFYSFTIDENTSFDVELSVDPEMLGRIFENLLAEINPETGESARKATGSFYTPRIIVDYMVDRTLSLYLQKSTALPADKIEALISYDKTDDLAFPLTESEKISVVNAINRFTALDPACGSGAFPMGLLQKLVFVLEEIDPDCSKWIDEQCSVLPTEIRKQVRNSLKIKGPEYVRKLGLIRQCIYGIDIQPIATEISRLRCFLTLIVDERVDDFQENRGIEPLPNLEFKFVTANSLLSLEKTSEKVYEGSLFENGDHVEELADIRNSFFSAVSDEKELIRSEFKRVQANMRRGLSQTKSEVSSKYEKLSSWKPFSLDATNWFDARWMFGLDEFSVVLANPPYLGEKGHKEVFGALKEGALGNFYSKNMDLFYFFFHQAINLTAHGGHIAFITTNYYPTATFAHVLRSDMRDRTSPKELINFNELRIFEAAPGQHNLITILEKSDCETNCRIVVADKKGIASQNVLRQVLEGDAEVSSLTVTNGSIFDGEEAYIRFSTSDGDSVLKRLADLPDRLGDVCVVRQGFVANPDKFKKSHRINYSRIKAEDGDGIFVLTREEARAIEDAVHLRPFYKNSDISKFATAKSTNLSVVYLNRDLSPTKEEKRHLKKFREILDSRREVVKGVIPWYSLHWPREQYMFEGAKIVGPQRSNLNTFGFNDQSWYASADVYFIKESDPEFPLKPILGLLNSRLYYYWLYHRGKRKGEMLELYQVPLSEIPIPQLTSQQKAQLTKIVDECIKSVGKEPLMIDAEGKLNSFVNALFDLKNEDIEIINEAYENALRRKGLFRDVEEE
jgi:adenine-specific DNA-methyltransferase